MRINKFHIFIPACFAIMFSCKENQAGGKAVIQGRVKHHERIIPFARVFIKYNAKEFPGPDTTLYDQKISTGADAEYNFECYKGDYFLYGYGYDASSLEIVTGGTKAHVRNKEVLEIDIPVTE